MLRGERIGRQLIRPAKEPLGSHSVARGTASASNVTMPRSSYLHNLDRDYLIRCVRQGRDGIFTAEDRSNSALSDAITSSASSSIP